MSHNRTVWSREDEMKVSSIGDMSSEITLKDSGCKKEGDGIGFTYLFLCPMKYRKYWLSWLEK
jgi:hypothetical protein